MSLALLLVTACSAPEHRCPPAERPTGPSAASPASGLDETGGLRLTYSVGDSDEDAQQRVAAAFRQRVVESGAGSARVYRLNRNEVVVDVAAGVDPKLLRELLRGFEAPGSQSEVRFEGQSTFGPALQ